jgi:peptidoglycan/xylan/chitin deacetylase (PgdA/CDA1 family)
VEFAANGLREILDVWLDAGADLGNHSYSHKNLNNVTLDEFTADIARGEPEPPAWVVEAARSL